MSAVALNRQVPRAARRAPRAALLGSATKKCAMWSAPKIFRGGGGGGGKNGGGGGGGGGVKCAARAAAARV